MLATNALALKEWAVVVHALLAGQQILLLRKGGLYERQGRFSTDPQEFFFFPTYVHQMEQGVVSSATPALQTALGAMPPAEQLWIPAYATVAEVRWLAAREAVAALEGLHCWTPETVEKRFFYKNPGLYLFLLRVYRLPQCHRLPLLKRYAGCRSWVELEEALDTSGATPVVEDEAFSRQRMQVEERLR